MLVARGAMLARRGVAAFCELWRIPAARATACFTHPPNTRPPALLPPTPRSTPTPLAQPSSAACGPGPGWASTSQQRGRPWVSGMGRFCGGHLAAAARRPATGSHAPGLRRPAAAATAGAARCTRRQLSCGTVAQAAAAAAPTLARHGALVRRRLLVGSLRSTRWLWFALVLALVDRGGPGLALLRWSPRVSALQM